VEGTEPGLEEIMTAGGTPPAHREIRRLDAGDFADVWRIGQLSPGAAQWSRTAYEHLLETAAEGWVVLAQRLVVGFIVVRLAVDEMEILNFAVLPEYRRKGLGRKLLEVALRESRLRGAKRAYLEVRATNSTAVDFYRNSAFKFCGCRSAYYTDPVEDAVVMERNLED
jgi:[ribosomal protein S18]-alanine N-acetyltransferase